LRAEERSKEPWQDPEQEIKFHFSFFMVMCCLISYISSLINN